MKHSFSYFFLFIFIASIFITNAVADSFEYPLRVEKINRSQANYLSPENTYFSINSCTIDGNTDWCDETMTVESREEYISYLHESGIERSQIFELAKNVKKTFIIDRFEYNDAIVLLVEDHSYSGNVNIMPLAFVREDGLWKLTNKYADDEEFNNYIYYIPPLFDGKGGRPTDVNKFLGYAQPTEARTELAPGANSYTVHVYYGRTVDPATFSAELNREDVTGLFSPHPLSDEEVEIHLQQGRNTLVLSIEGARDDDKKARDTDRLVFIVPQER